jgi:hypothetical protein
MPKSFGNENMSISHFFQIQSLSAKPGKDDANGYGQPHKHEDHRKKGTAMVNER